MPKQSRSRAIWRAVKAVLIDVLGAHGSKTNVAPFEHLESRILLTNITQPYTPGNIATAYAINNMPTNATGAGQTIAIIVPFNDTNILNEVNAFISLSNQEGYHLPSFGNGGPSFTVDNQNGQTLGPRGIMVPPPDPANTNWDEEAASDVEWAHVVAPMANIILFEAQNSASANETTAIENAAATQNVSVVSMSWGDQGNQDAVALAANSNNIFTTPAHKVDAANNPEGVTFVAATGDVGQWGNSPVWPAASANVLAVGGVDISINGDGTLGSEIPENQSGRGYSSRYAGFQKVIANGVNPSYSISNARGAPDVSWVYGAVQIVCTNQQGALVTLPWSGTSLATPMWAGLIADIDSDLVSIGKPSLYNYPQGTTTVNGRTLTNDQAQGLLYGIASDNDGFGNPTPFRTVGNNVLGNGLPFWSSSAGLGTPNAPALIAAVQLKHGQTDPAGIPGSRPREPKTESTWRPGSPRRASMNSTP